jgi:CPA2 family monovalent cation:H+ antiporter-2
MMLLAATGGEQTTVFLEIGAVALGLAVLARIAGRLGITTIPFYLVAGLLLGEGGLAPLDVSADLISLMGEIGVLLLLFTLGLEYSAGELRAGLRDGVVPGVVDAVVNFAPGFAVGLLLGWEVPAAVLLGGVCWVTSSGIVAKVMSDLDWFANRELPAVLNLLVIEDLAMAVFLPLAATLATGQPASDTVVTVAIALAAVGVILAAAVRYGVRLSAVLSGGSDEALLLAVFGLTLLVGGLAQTLDVSAAIGAFLVGLALSGPVQTRAAALIGPLRDLFAAVFFLFFSFQIRPGDVARSIAPALALAAVCSAGKFATGWLAAKRAGVGPAGRKRAGSILIARGEFSIVIASLGATTADGHRLGALAASFVLLTAIAGPVAARAVAHRGETSRQGAL